MQTITQALLSLAGGTTVIFGVPAYFIHRWTQKEKRAEQARLDASRSAVEQIGGSALTELENGRPRSAQRRKPLGELYKPKTIREGMTFPGKPPTVDLAMDVLRGRRQFRVSEYYASVRAGSNSPRRVFEYTIETRTGPVSGMKIAKAYPPDLVRIFGRTRDLRDHRHRVFGAEARSSPSVGRWEQFPLPDNEFTGYTSDPAFAAQAITPDIVDWLRGNRDQLPDLVGLDHGWCYAVYRRELDPETLVAEIDLIAEFLDRLGVPVAG
ncbi:hypothetical protein [Amycolatopsis benzoatilytica]|uniref:hypothetical protein n=1 Tax=Amycolatopsis benzoatilytica TaxID=346045 RepID=UPI00037C0D57|nr:hypothetical protein [Amycolatopsis benzoatilytica]